MKERHVDPRTGREDCACDGSENERLVIVAVVRHLQRQDPRRDRDEKSEHWFYGRDGGWI